jgi:predicted Zn-dependent protease
VALQEALALALVRQQRKPEALRLLARASARPGATTRSRYLYALALADAGRAREAVAALEAAARQRPDRDVLLALAAYRRDAGDAAGAQAALDRLAAINPGDPALGRRFPP